MKKHTEQELTRRNSLKELESLGVNPYPADEFETNTNNKEIKTNYSIKNNNFQNVKIAGRMMSRRIMGKASFVEIKDAFGRIQAYVNRDEVCEGEDKTLYNQIFKKMQFTIIILSQRL